MKVLIINAESGAGGGPAAIVNGIAETIESNGNISVVAYGRQHDKNSGVKTYKIGNKISIYLHYLLSRTMDCHGLGSILATKRLTRYMDSFKPDVINIHNIHGYYLNYLILFKYISDRDIPVVWTLHDCWPITGHCAYFDRISCSKWKKGCEECPLRLDYPKTILDFSRKNYNRKKRLFNMPGQMVLVSPSEWLQEIISESYLCRYERITIHNGIDLNKFSPNQNDWKENHGIVGKKMVLGVASCWSERKGLNDLIKIADMLDDQYVVVIVGLSTKQIQGIPSQILGIRRTENVKELVDIYSAADVLVNTSIEDNFPTVILESLACGTPVITYDTGGCKEALNNECGSVVQQGNIEKIIHEIIKITHEEKKVKECLERIKYFDMKKKYSEYIELFSRIVDKTILLSTESQ